MHRSLILVAVAVPAILVAGCNDVVTPPAPTLDPGDVTTVMGIPGFLGYNGEERTPEETGLYFPIDLNFDLEGRLIVDDWNNYRIRRVDDDGKVRTIVGTGWEDVINEGSHPLDTPLHHAFSIAYDARGDMFLAGFHVPQIIEVKDDVVHIIAGTDDFGYTGDGGPARQAELNSPCGVDVAAAGAPVYLADTYNHAIRVLDADGMIHTLAGTGEPGYSGDGGPAAEAQLNEPYRVRYDEASGNLYVCDTFNHAVRRISSDGIITSVAGTGVEGYSGDGGPGSQAQLAYPYDARVGPDGAVYIADSANHRIRRVTPDGIITTVAGTGERGKSGDLGPALQATFNNPSAVAFDDKGNLWIADTYNSTVRMVLGFFETP